MKNLKFLFTLLIVSVIAICSPVVSYASEGLILAGTKAASPGVLTISLLLGLVFYFIAAYRQKKMRQISPTSVKFKIATWVKDNWFNVLCYFTGVFLYSQTSLEINALEAFGLGVVPNKLIDWIQAEIGY